MYESFSDKCIKLGPWSSYSLRHDPKHIAFVMSRYKFCSKILNNKKTLLEIGCGDALGIYILAQNKQYVYCIDNDDIVDNNMKRISIKNVQFLKCDILTNTIHIPIVESAIAVDVIEHIDSQLENIFLTNICRAVKKNGIVIIGTPNKTSELYASPQSNKYHVNLYTQDRLNNLMEQYFINVLNFGMNDEIIHTGFGPMSHYLFSVGIGLK